MLPEIIYSIGSHIVNIKQEPRAKVLIPRDQDWYTLYQKIHTDENWTQSEIFAIALFLGATWHSIKDGIPIEDVNIDEYEICKLIFNF